MRSRDRSARYPHIIFDLQNVDQRYRQVIIDDIPLSLYSYNDICNITLNTDDVVHVYIDYADSNDVKDEDNVLVVHLRLEPYTYESSTYVMYINIQDTYKTCNNMCLVYSVFFLTDELNLPHDWHRNNKYSIHREELENKEEYILNIDAYDAKSLTINASTKTVVFDSAYFIEHCECK